ncbi:MAG: PAS domain S-box protein [Ignavibacteriae bacterium]|nr:PAS domain S-box protein [Ignavibacteriota bacterium]
MGWSKQAELYCADDRMVIESGKSKLFIEEPQTTPDGNTITLLTSKMPLRNSKGEITGVLGTYIDISERKKAEDKIKDSEERYRLLIEHLPDGILIHTDGIIVYANQSSIRLFGGDRERIIGFPVLNFVHPDYLPAVKDRIKTIVGINKEVPIIEEKLLKLDGTIFDAEVTAIPFNFQGKSSVQVLVHDITARKKIELDLKASEQKYANLVENINDVIFSINTEGVLDYVSPVIKSVAGYDPDDIIGHKFREFIYPGDFDELYESFKRILSGETQSNEYRIITKSGEIRWIMSSSNPIYSGEKIIGLTGVLSDITIRKKTEEERIKLRKAVETSGEIIFMTDTSGNFSYINPEFTRLYGWKAEEIIGKLTPRILNGGTKDPEFYQNFWNKITNKQVVKSEIINKTKDNKLINIELSANPILNDKGEISGFLAIQKDISDRKKAEEELIKAKEKAEDMNKLKSSFLANMSHELRTPMNGIMGFSQILQFEDDINNVHEITNLVYKSSKRLMQTLNSILDLSRIESGDMKPVFNYADLIDLANETISLYQADAQRNNIDLKLDSKFDNYYFNTDQKIVIDILNNLVNNAIKFTQEGSITIIIDNEIISDKEYIVFTVKDTGIGIDEKDYETIFDEFRQVSEGLNRGFEGTGLGLTLTRKYVELLGGSIGVQGKLGEGSSFTVKLPITEIPEFEIEKITDEDKLIASLTKNRIKTSKHKILYVEDDDVSQLLVNKLLSDMYEINYAQSYDEAISKVNEESYSLILMDINLGKGKNGIDATQEIRNMNNYRNIPIIAVTAFAMEGDREEFIGRGCTDYLSKPFESKGLLNIMKKYL